MTRERVRDGACVVERQDYKMFQKLRALFLRALPLPIHRPTLPDRWSCHADYGHSILPLDCQQAVDNNWPSGKTPIYYRTSDPASSNSLLVPRSDHVGETCSFRRARPISLMPSSQVLVRSQSRQLGQITHRQFTTSLQITCEQ